MLDLKHMITTWDLMSLNTLKTPDIMSLSSLSLCPPAASSSGRQRDSDHPGDVPGLEEEEKAGEGWNTFNRLFIKISLSEQHQNISYMSLCVLLINRSTKPERSWRRRRPTSRLENR